jgi:hypothetical protein
VAIRPPAGTSALAIVTVVWIVAIAAAPFLPFVDLPQHVASARLLWNLDRPELAALYETRLFPQVNVLGLFVSAPLFAWLPEAAAARALVGLYLAGLAWALWRLTRAAKVPAWSALGGMLFALHLDWMYGFLSFCLGMPILLALWARLAQALTAEDGAVAQPPPDWRSLLADAALWILVVLAHALLFAFGAASLLLWIVVVRHGRRARLLRAVAALPAGVWLVASLAASHRVLETPTSPSAASGVEALWEGPLTKLVDFGRSLLVASTNSWLEWTVLASVALFVVLALRGERRRSRAAPPGRRFLRWVALLAVIAYAALPYSIYDRRWVTYGLFILYQRFLVLAPLLLLPTLEWPARPRARAGLGAVAVGANLLLAIHWQALFARVGQQADGLDAAIEAIPRGAIVKSLIFTPYPDGLRFEAFLHVASYYQARRFGETDQSFALLPSSPVHYRDPARRYLSRNDEHLRPQEFDLRQAALYGAIFAYDRNGEWLRPASAPLPVHFGKNGWLVLETR